MDDESYILQRITEIHRAYQIAIEKSLYFAVEIYKISIPKIYMNSDGSGSHVEFEFSEENQNTINQCQEMADHYRAEREKELAPWIERLHRYDDVRKRKSLFVPYEFLM